MAAGTYDASLWQTAFTRLYGGFAGTETERVQRDPAAHETILDGGGRADSVVFSPAGLTFNVLDGFTVRNGTGHRGRARGGRGRSDLSRRRGRG